MVPLFQDFKAASMITSFETLMLNSQALMATISSFS